MYEGGCCDLQIQRESMQRKHVIRALDWEAEKLYLQQNTRNTTWKCGEAVNLQNPPLVILPAKQKPPH